MSQWKQCERIEHRKKNNIPNWVPIGDDDPHFKRLWVEDDARPPDGEHITEAWKRIFGEEAGSVPPLARYDGDNYQSNLYPGNRVYEVYPGGSSIWQYIPPRKFN